MVTNFHPRTSQSVVKTNIFSTRHAFHTLYAVLGDARRRKINSCLGVLLTSFAPFSERGFDNYLQHFVVMATDSSHLSLCFFACAVSAFWEGPSLSSFLDFSTFGSKNYNILDSKIHDFWPSRNDQIESHRRPPPDPAEARQASTAAIRPSPEPSIIQPNTRSPACGFLLVNYIDFHRNSIKFY